MSWMITADKLDEQQNHFIFEKSRSKENIWIKGFAGSGKSVLLIHTIIDKIKENPNANICVVVFTHSLIQMFRAGMKELGIPEKNISFTTYHQFRKTRNSFDYIFCDEVQDLPKSILEDMKSRTKQLILAGDSNQSIYTNDPSTHEPTVNQSEIENIINSTPYELNTIYRLTKSIIKVVSNLIPEMNLFSSKTDRTKKDVSVRLCEGNSEYQEVEYILSQANEAISINESVVIILPTHNDIIKFINIALDINGKQGWEIVMDNWQKPNWYNLNKYLYNNRVNIEYVGNGAGHLFDSVRVGKMIIMTYHSVKGLDFDNVFLPFVSNSLNIRNKTLFMVGMTRSKEALYLTYSGNMHEYVYDFKDECTIIDIDTINNDDDDDFDFDF